MRSFLDWSIVTRSSGSVLCHTLLLQAAMARRDCADAGAITSLENLSLGVLGGIRAV